MRVAMLAPNMDATDVGEAYVAFKWAEMIQDKVDLTVLAFQRPGRPPLADQLPRAEVVTWPEPAWLQRAERFNAMLKPAYPLYARRVRRWLRMALAEGRQFDIGHQIMPLAARYPSPLTGLEICTVIGPLGGTLETPQALRGETGSANWYTRLRGLDRLRFRYDPWLRRSYEQADLVLGVAPYMKQALQDMALKSYENMLELGIDTLAAAPVRPEKDGPGLRLLHVGRAVRTKGLRDVVRALAHLKDLPEITLVSAGGGEELALCQAEARDLGVADRITFEGKVPRTRVQELYAEADVFVFPSFREPTGGVLYEAMQAGLPVIACAYGGPDYIIDDTCGLKVAPAPPERFAADIAAQIRQLAGAPDLRQRLGRGARSKVEREGPWPSKAARLLALYTGLQ